MSVLTYSFALSVNISVMVFVCRKPVFAGSIVVLRAKYTEKAGRKEYLSAYMESEDGVKLADATSLFIKLRSPGPTIVLVAVPDVSEPVATA
jgi:hypothetical protein